MAVSYAQVARTKRECLGLTQVEFGKIVGVSGSAIACFENGKEVSEVIVKSIRYNLRLLEDGMPERERYIYHIIKEAKLTQFENNDELLQDKLDNIMFACLRLRKYLSNQ